MEQGFYLSGLTVTHCIITQYNCQVCDWIIHRVPAGNVTCHVSSFVLSLSRLLRRLDRSDSLLHRLWETIFILVCRLPASWATQGTSHVARALCVVSLSLSFSLSPFSCLDRTLVIALRETQQTEVGHRRNELAKAHTFDERMVRLYSAGELASTFHFADAFECV